MKINLGKQDEFEELQYQGEKMELEQEKFEILKNACEDKISELFYYDRKECEDISVEDMEKLSKEQLKELCEWFTKCVLNNQ